VPATASPATLEVPTGKDLRITDLILENVASDSGLAIVLKNEQFLTSWNLFRSYASHDACSRSPPFLLPSGTTLTFMVRCDSPGNDVALDEPEEDAGKCIERLLISGTLVPSGS